MRRNGGECRIFHKAFCDSTPVKIAECDCRDRQRGSLALKHGIGREEDMRLPIGLELESGEEDERIRVLGIETIG